MDFSKWVEGGTGTADCIILADGTAEIIDYKHGLGVLVSAESEEFGGNPQLMCYCLGILTMFDGIYDIDTVKMVIYQPRRENVSIHTMTKDELLKWAEDTLAPTALLAMEGKGEFAAGDHCQFCKVKATCRKRAEYNLELARYDFQIPKSDVKTIEKIKAAIQAAYEEGQSKLKGNGKSVPALSTLKTPLRDGDLERPDDEAYKNSYFINANSGTAPGIVDADRNPIIDRSEMYSGVKGRASINLYAYNVNGNRGIACGLNNLQKISDGTPLGGKSRAEDDFATEDDEDFLN